MSFFQNWQAKAVDVFRGSRTAIRRFLRRLRSRLWVRPAFYCLLAVFAVSFGWFVDYQPLKEYLPDISFDTIETLLSVLTASMLGVATFAVASMVSAYASVSTNATPRAFTLIVSDGISKNALSTFIGAFIFGTIGIIAVKFQYYGVPGRFALFVITLGVYAWVVLTFVRWVDAIARLGRLTTAIDRVEEVTADALGRRSRHPYLDSTPALEGFWKTNPVYADTVGYVQDVEVSVLQDAAEKGSTRIQVAAPPGTFVAPGKPLAYVKHKHVGFEPEWVRDAFWVGDQRTFDFDPRFGLITLSEIGSRALSPGINDPGTAIDIIGTHVRLFTAWAQPDSKEEIEEEKTKEKGEEAKTDETLYPLVRFPALDVNDMFEDAFQGISRDGAGTVEVMIRLQKAFAALSHCRNADVAEAAKKFSEIALDRARLALEYQGDLKKVEAAAAAINAGAAKLQSK